MILDEDGFLHSLTEEEKRNLPEVLVLPQGTVTVSEGLFRKSAVREVVFPEGVECLERGAFSGCPNLVRVQFPATLRNLEAGVFGNCPKLEEADLPDGLVYLGPDVFCRTALKRVRIPPGILAVGDECFQNCSRLEEVDFSEGLLEIGASAFAFCRRLRSVVLPQSLLCLQENCFQGCFGLERVVPGDRLLRIRSGAFSSCVGLEKLRIPASVESVGSACFEGCRCAGGIVVEGTPEFSETAVFSVSNVPLLAPGLIRALRGTDLVWNLCLGFLGADAPSEETVAAYHSLFLAEQVSGMVRSTHPEFFGPYRDQTRRAALLRVPCMPRYLVEHNLLLEDSILECMEVARARGDRELAKRLVFYEAPDLHSPAAEDHLVFGKNIVHWVPGTEVLDPGTVEEVFFPDSLTFLPGGVCEQFRCLRRVHLPKNLRTIPPSAFRWCMELEEIAIPDGVVSVGERAFEHSGLRTLDLPASVLFIGREAFRASALTSVRFREGLLEICEHAFEACQDLREVSFPGSLCHIRASAFGQCTALKEISFREGLLSIGDHAFGSSEIQRIVLPSTLLNTGAYSVSCRELVLLGSHTRLLYTKCFIAQGTLIFAPAMPPDRIRDPKLQILFCRGFIRMEQETAVAPWIREAYLSWIHRWRTSIWTVPWCLRFLLRNCLLDLEDIEPCLQDLAPYRCADLTAAVLQYRHDRFPVEDQEEMETLEPLSE